MIRFIQNIVHPRSLGRHRQQELEVVEQRHRNAIRDNADAFSKLFNDLLGGRSRDEGSKHEPH